MCDIFLFKVMCQVKPDFVEGLSFPVLIASERFSVVYSQPKGLGLAHNWGSLGYGRVLELFPSFGDTILWCRNQNISITILLKGNTDWLFFKNLSKKDTP